MPGSYKIDKQQRLVITTVSGAIDLDEGLKLQQAMAADPDFDPDFYQLMDLSQVTAFNISAGDIRVFAAKSIFSPMSRRAILASANVVFGLARMYELLRETSGQMNVRVFRSRDEALAWLFLKSEEPLGPPS